MKQVIKDEGGPEARPQRRRRISTREQAALSAALPAPIRQMAKPIEIIRDERYVALKARLHAEWTKFNDQLIALRNNLKIDKRDTHAADADEMAQNEGQLATASAEINFISDQMTAVNAAQRSLENGTYGKCEVCEQDIPEIRLNAIPFAKTCIPCT